MSEHAATRSAKPRASFHEHSPALGWRRWPARLLIVGCALALAGCESGTSGGTELRHRAEVRVHERPVHLGGGPLRRESREGRRVGLVLVDTNNARSGEYRLEAVIAVKQGTAEVTIQTESGEEAGEQVSHDSLLRIQITVEVDDDEDLVAALRVRDEEARGLVHETTLTPR